MDLFQLSKAFSELKKDALYKELNNYYYDRLSVCSVRPVVASKKLLVRIPQLTFLSCC